MLALWINISTHWTQLREDYCGAYKTDGEIDTSPTVGNGFVYVGSNDKRVYALEALDGELVWQYESYYENLSSPTLAAGVVYFGAGYSLLAVNASTGEALWDDHIGSYADTKPVVADGIVHLGDAHMLLQ